MLTSGENVVLARLGEPLSINYFTVDQFVWKEDFN